MYLALVVAVAGIRLLELRRSQRHTAAMLARGGIEVGRGHYLWMVALHTAWLIACPLEVFALHRPFVPTLGWPMLGLVVAAMALRSWSIITLGGRWSTRIVLVSGEPVVRRGPYRRLRHPNYLAVIAELLALPLVHTAWITALAAGLANAWLLAVRIRTEEAALGRGADYGGAFAHLPRFFGPARGRR